MKDIDGNKKNGVESGKKQHRLQKKQIPRYKGIMKERSFPVQFGAHGGLSRVS